VGFELTPEQWGQFASWCAFWVVAAWFLWRVYEWMFRPPFRGEVIGRFEVMGKMASNMNMRDIGVVTGLALVRASGKQVPLTAEEVHVETGGPIKQVAVPAGAPEGAVLAFAPTDRGQATISIAAAAAPDATALIFEVDIEDPDVSVVGNLVVLTPPPEPEPV